MMRPGVALFLVIFCVLTAFWLKTGRCERDSIVRTWYSPLTGQEQGNLRRRCASGLREYRLPADLGAEGWHVAEGLRVKVLSWLHEAVSMVRSGEQAAGADGVRNNRLQDERTGDVVKFWCTGTPSRRARYLEASKELARWSSVDMSHLHGPGSIVMESSRSLIAGSLANVWIGQH